jgi:hypothetical protein
MCLWDSTASADLNGLCRIFGHRKILNMEFFQLQHPLNATVLCDRKGCAQVADYLEVDHGHEYRVCAMRTDSKTHTSRLPTRKPSPDLPFRSDLLPGPWAAPLRPAGCKTAIGRTQKRYHDFDNMLKVSAVDDIATA